VVKGLVDRGAEVRVVSTHNAQHFWKETDLPSDVRVYRDADEWSTWSKMGDEVLHIELRKWADLFVIAPLDANTLGKIANGQCDNLLTCVARAWDVEAGTMVVAPAMNTLMFSHPITKQQLDILTGWGIVVLPTVAKKLACGDVGDGAMAEYQTIVDYVMKAVEKHVK
jgi:phosphopantothenoylcysteine decarboxylase